MLLFHSGNEVNHTMNIFLLLLLLMLGIVLIPYLKVRRRVPILMYHRLAAIPGDRNALPPEKFKEQLEYLASHGYHTISPNDLYQYYHNKKPLPSKPILLTFDDGYTDNFTEALPLLKKYHMTATVCPISDWIGRENKWENFNKALTTTMSYEQLEEWSHAGMQIISHTVNHPFLSQLTGDELSAELKNSKASLETKLGMPIDYLCYPYGDFTAETKQAARQAGYKIALAIFDRVPLWDLDLLALPRIPIPCHQRMWEFKLKVSKIHLIFIALRQLERWLKQKIRRQKK